MRHFLIGLVVAALLPFHVAIAGGLEEAITGGNSMRAGFYLQIPFSGGLKQTAESDLTYGLSFGATRRQPVSSFMQQARRYDLDMVKFNFNSAGFSSFNLAGQPVFSQRGFALAQDGSGGASDNKWLLIGGGVVLVAIGIVALGGDDGICSAGGNPEDYPDNQCPGIVVP